MAKLTIDAKGLSCPLPIMKTKKATRDLPAGSVYEVLATDPGVDPDFRAYCRATGDELLELERSNGVFRILIRKGE